MKKLSVEQLRVLQLDMLDYIDTICRENNIKYQLGFGSLIGAVRHKGFIPWDDDIDLCMYRDDYEKLAKIIEAKKDERYKVMNFKNTDWYFQNFMVVVDKKTLIKSRVTKKNIDTNVFIDVFVIDKFDDLKVVEKTYKEFALEMLSVHKLKYIFHKDSKLKDIARFITWCLVYFISPKYYAKKIRKLIAEYRNDDGKFEGILGQDKGKYKNVFPNGTFEELIEMPFENKLYPVPKNYDLILKQLYGDYMQEPSEETKILNSHMLDAYEIE